jgi:cytochrome c biogenesis protein CcmG/thiol:disulfide interchange protein DsbE
MNTPPDNSSTPVRRLPTFVIVLAFVVLLGFLTLLALGLRRSQQGPITKGSQVPPLEITTFDGEVIRTEELAGKVILINFWASWCRPCEDEAGYLQQAWEYYQAGDNVIFVGVDYVDTEPEARAYLEKFGITYPNAPDLGTRISQTFRIRGVPETYIIDRQGRLAEVLIGGFNSTQEIIQMVDGLLQ